VPRINLDVDGRFGDSFLPSHHERTGLGISVESSSLQWSQIFTPSFSLLRWLGVCHSEHKISLASCNPSRGQ
jgi:hypothetical protein